MCGFVDAERSGGCYPCAEVPNMSFAGTTQTAVTQSFGKPRHRRVVSYDAAPGNAIRRTAMIQPAAPVQQHQVAATQPVVMAQPATSAALETKSYLDLSASDKIWLNLLHDRPDLEQDSMMSSWMDKIISLSEEQKGCEEVMIDPASSIAEDPLFSLLSPESEEQYGLATIAS